MNKAYCFVHITDISYTIDKGYCYSVPSDLRNEIKIGSVVVVAFGNANKRMSAVVVGFAESCDYPHVKAIDSIMNYPFEVPEELIRTCGFMKERFFCSFGSAFRAVIPPGVNLGTETVYELADGADLTKLNSAAEVLVRHIKLKSVCTERELIGEFGEESKKLLASLCRSRVLIRKSRVPEKLNEKNLFTYELTVSQEKANELIDANSGLTEKQKGLLSFLLHYPTATMREIEEIGGFSSAIANALIKKSLVEKRETSIFREAYSFDGIEPEGEIILSDEQKKVIDGLKTLAGSGEAKAALLFGVTGSGKTRVIIETAKSIIASGRQVIVLIPEIGLASQAVKAYASAFGNRLAVIHSMLSVGERTDSYRKILAGDIDIVIGTRSAVFAPFTRLGMIAVDEEQAHTYKSEMQPKYNAIDVARFRCSETNSLMLLASATPSVESFYKAKKGIYSLFTLSNRFSGSELPEVIIEDLREDSSLLGERLIGRRLSEEIRQTKELGKQSLLFINRRGYNSHISCRDCGYVFSCPNCSVSLTHHAYEGVQKGGRRLSCHYCGFTTPLPKKCPICGGAHIGYSGYGTQKLHDELESDFPKLKVTRMDSDTTGGKFSHDRLIEEFANGETDILIGTQMVSKGLDFPNVRIASALAIDNALYMDDFRAGERSFSLITQLVGRAGRAGMRGKAILQTYNPDNETLKLAATQDYEKFFESEIKLRKAVVFPPFCAMAVFIVSSVNENDCENFARRLDTLLLSLYDKAFSDIKIFKFGPFRNGIYKVMGKYRQRIIIKYKDCARSREFLVSVLSEGLTATPKNVKLELEANPNII